MKKLLIYLFVLVIPVLLIGQKQDIDPNGYNKFYYGNGQIASEGKMKNGKPNGYWKTYYVNGNTKSEGNRKNFELDSMWVFYDNEGDTTNKINYRDGKKNGYYYTYKYEKDDNGNKLGGLISKELYLNDVMQGTSIYYDIKEGFIDKMIIYKENKKNGLAKGFGKDGRITTLIEYRNDVLINREYINRFNRENLKQGIWKEFHLNDMVKSEANYINGKIHGLYKEYDNSGKLLKIEKYLYGERVIENKENIDTTDNSYSLKELFASKIKEEYHDNGKIKSIGAFNDTVPVGEHKTYSENGKSIRAKVYDNYGNVKAKGYYNDRGKKHGKWWYYYDLGKLKAEGKYYNGLKNEEWKFYFEGGNLEQEGLYLKGKLDGVWKWYYKNGQIEREEEYIEGEENGPIIEYDKYGNIIEKGQYLEGEKTGFWYYNAGDHTEEGDYLFGQKEGMWKYYYENNKKFFIGKFVQGKEDGKHRYYYENGKTKTEGRYVYGSKEGSWYYYTYDGELIYIIKYKDDIEYKINGEKVKLDQE